MIDVPAPIEPEKRAAILAAIDGERAARDIAAEFGVSPSTVSKIARDEGIVAAFARTRTERATRAKTIDNQSRRAALAVGLLDDVDRLRRMFFAQYAHPMSGGEFGPSILTLELPPAGEIRNLVTSAAVLIDKHVVLDRHDNDGGAAAGLSLIGKIAGAIANAAGEPYVDPHTAPGDAEDAPDEQGEGGPP